MVWRESSFSMADEAQEDVKMIEEEEVWIGEVLSRCDSSERIHKRREKTESKLPVAL